MDKRLCKYEGCTRGPEKTRNWFEPRLRDKDQWTQYCHPDCYHADRQGKKLDPAVVARRPKRKTRIFKTCPTCAKEFEISTPHQKFCTVPCASRYNAKQRAAAATRKKHRAKTSPLVSSTKTRQRSLVGA